MDTSFSQYSPPAPLVIELAQPIKSGTRQFSTITLGEPTAGQVHAAELHLAEANGAKGTRMYLRALIASMAKMPEEAVSSMPMGSFQRAADHVQSFVLSGLENEAPKCPELSIAFEPPLEIADGTALSSLHVNEPTLDHMMKADAALRDMSPYHVRHFQMLLVSMAAGEKGIMKVVGRLPISVLNRAASYCMGFTTADRRTSTT